MNTSTSTVASAPPIRIAMAQIAPLVGDFQANLQQIVLSVQQAAAAQADLVLFPELTLCGYLPEDWLHYAHFREAHDQALATLATLSSDYPQLCFVVGHLQNSEQGLYNAASLWQGGKCLHTYYKQSLPNYGVFDEQRYFAPGHAPRTFVLKGHRFGLAICEDVWLGQVSTQAQALGVQTLLVLNASPYSIGKQAQRHEAVGKVADLGIQVFYVNQVGAQDDLLFDGQSFAMNARGFVVSQEPAFQPRLALYTLQDNTIRPEVAQPLPLPFGQLQSHLPEAVLHDNSLFAQVWQGLVLSLQAYYHRLGFEGVVLGLSGGIDSAVVLALAVDALGAERIQTAMMPSPYTADISVQDALRMAQHLNVRHHILPIADLYDQARSLLAPAFMRLPVDTTEENIQARLRGMLVMALANKYKALALTTGNKSELAVGYCTLYGDMAGGFAPLKDVPKTLVYELAQWRNRISPVIPTRIITRPPSAELRPDQCDQDSLPPYEVLDALVAGFVENGLSVADLIEQGYAPEAVKQVAHLLRINEHKRRQGAIGPKITNTAFGREWRMPICHGFHF